MPALLAGRERRGKRHMASRDLRAASGAPDGAPSPSTPDLSVAEEWRAWLTTIQVAEAGEPPKGRSLTFMGLASSAEKAGQNALSQLEFKDYAWAGRPVSSEVTDTVTAFAQKIL